MKSEFRENLNNLPERLKQMGEKATNRRLGGLALLAIGLVLLALALSNDKLQDFWLQL